MCKSIGTFRGAEILLEQIVVCTNRILCSFQKYRNENTVETIARRYDYAALQSRYASIWDWILVSWRL